MSAQNMKSNESLINKEIVLRSSLASPALTIFALVDMASGYKYISKKLVSMYPLADVDETIPPLDEVTEDITIDKALEQEIQQNDKKYEIERIQEIQAAESVSQIDLPADAEQSPKFPPLLNKKRFSVGYVDTAAADMGALPMRGDRRHDWKRIQMTTFTNWVNDRLSSSRGASIIKDLSTDLQDGLTLIQLVENLTSKRMHGYNKAPAITAQKISNLEVAIKFLREDDVKIVGIGIYCFEKYNYSRSYNY